MYSEEELLLIAEEIELKEGDEILPEAVKRIVWDMFIVS